MRVSTVIRMPITEGTLRTADALLLIYLYLVSLPQSHNAAFASELSRPLEFERCEVTLQVMRWFGFG